MEKQIYQLKISLKYFKPEIWRRVLVASDILLPDLHMVIQIAMGWENEHTHQFMKDKVFFRPPDPESGTGKFQFIDYKKTYLYDVIQTRREKFQYEYDFGDSWLHDIQLEKIMPAEDMEMTQRCIDGKLNCPPEDCGGVWDYEQIYKMLTDPDAEQDDERLEWLGEDFDPEYFDVKEVNEKLDKYFMKKKKGLSTVRKKK